MLHVLQNVAILAISNIEQVVLACLIPLILPLTVAEGHTVLPDAHQCPFLASVLKTTISASGLLKGKL